MRGRGWILGTAASVLFHVAGLAAIGIIVRPAPPPDQSVPKARFSVQAAEVPRSTAALRKADTEPAPQTQANAAPAQQNAVAQTMLGAHPLAGSTAAPVPPTATAVRPAPVTPQTSAAQPTAAATLRPVGSEPAPLHQVSPEPAALHPVGPQAAPAAAIIAAKVALPAQTPQARAVTQTQATAAALGATLPVARLVRPKTPAAAKLRPTEGPAPTAITAPVQAVHVASAAPTGNAASAFAIAPDHAPPVTALAPAAPPARPTSQKAASLAPPAQVGKASLAWSGQSDDTLPPVSLAAIAAFTRQGDLSDDAMQVRDGITRILASVPCARLQTTFNAETGQLELRGHIPEDGLRAPVVEALRAAVGDAIALSDNLLILPRPQCGALAGVAQLGLPQSVEQLKNPAVIGEDGFARNTTFYAGDQFYLDLVAADYDSYVYVDYFVADGSVIHLQPNEVVAPRAVPAFTPLTVGKSTDDTPALALSIGPPYGQEIAVAFAASVPLYDGVRPLQEPAGPYLTYMKDRIAQARAEHPDFKGEWVYFFITTRPAQ